MSKHYSRDYYKMMRNNRKKLVQAAKSVYPWNCEAYELLIPYLEWVRDYYKKGENIHAMENFEWNPEAIKKTRLEMVEEILNEYNEWQTCEDKYYKVVHHPETYKSHSNDDGTVTVDDLGFHVEYALGDHDLTNKAFNDEYNFHKHKFFELLEKYLEELSD